MNSLDRVPAWFVPGVVLLLSQPVPGQAQTTPDTGRTPAQTTAGNRDGQHDFDFEFGNWKVHLRRLIHPLTGSNTWVELDGTSIVRKVWDGRANLGELEVANSENNGIFVIDQGICILAGR